MRRSVLSLPAVVLLVVAILGSSARPSQAQGVLDAIKKKAQEAKKAADEVKRKADSTSLAAAKTKAAADSAKAAADSAKAAADSAKAAADSAKAAADSAKAAADSANAAADSAKAAADSAKAAAENARTSVESAARTITSPGAIAPAAPTPSQAGSPAARRPARGNAPAAPATAPSSGGSNGLSRSAAHVEEQVLLSGEAGTEFYISPRGQHIAARMLKGSRTVMVVDGVAGPPFDEIPGIAGETSNDGVFSDDGTHHAYVARQGQQWVVMQDGKEVARGGPFFQVSGNATMQSIGFTPGGKHLYFTIADIDHNKFQLFFDGKPDPVVQTAVLPVLSPDGEHYAYEFQVNKETGNPLPALMVDGRRAPYTGSQPRFTADGQHLYTTVGVPHASAMDVLLDGKPLMRVSGVTLHFAPLGSAMLASVLAIDPNGARSVFLTIGAKRVPNSDCHGSAGIDAVYFSADVKHWAVRCQDSNTSYWVMTDGKKGQEYQGIASDVTFTADGRPVYMAVANARQFIVVGDQEFGPYAQLQLQLPRGRENEPGVLPVPTVVAGNRVGYIAMESNTSGLNRLVVVDGKATKGVAPSDLAFSPDGSHFAYVEGQGGRSVVLDGVKRYTAPLLHESGDVPAQFVFSGDGKHLAFSSASQSNVQGRAVAVDDRLFVTDAGSHYDITFTPDGRHLVWMGIRRDGPRRRVYVDGEPVLEFDQPPAAQSAAGTWWTMGPDGVLTFIGQDGGALKRYRVTPGNGSVDARSRER